MMEMTSSAPVVKTLLTDWGKLLGDTAAVGAMLDRLLYDGQVLKMRAAVLNEMACPIRGGKSMKKFVLN